jgi:hypothetical protein
MLFLVPLLRRPSNGTKRTKNILVWAIKMSNSQPSSFLKKLLQLLPAKKQETHFNIYGGTIGAVGDEASAKLNQPTASLSNRLVSLSDLGYDLRYFTTLQNFGMASEKVSEIRKTARASGLILHSHETGDDLIRYYFDQLDDSQSQDVFNIGFFFAQLEVGAMLLNSQKTDAGLKEYLHDEIGKVRKELDFILQKFGIEKSLAQLPNEYSEDEIKGCRAKVIYEIRRFP